MNTDETCILVCNKLLRGELSAIETYEQALEKFTDPGVREKLTKILSEHRESAVALKSHVQEMQATPSTDSGAWGTFAQAVEGTAKLFGEAAGLLALKEGEKHGIREYEDALNDEGVMSSIKSTIRETLRPRLERHLSTLDSISVKDT